MAEINEYNGSIIARCGSSKCNGAKTGFDWKENAKQIGYTDVISKYDSYNRCYKTVQSRIYKCASCGFGSVAQIAFSHKNKDDFPGFNIEIIEFSNEAIEKLPIPKFTPNDIYNEFREAENCFEEKCNRAALALFRSVIEKVLNQHGYDNKIKKGEKTLKPSLADKIDLAKQEGIISLALCKRAHEKIRVVGNDILHDEWREVLDQEVEETREYCQRVLEAFYDDIETVSKIISERQETLQLEFYQS
jgi:hypothetical protein